MHYLCMYLDCRCTYSKLSTETDCTKRVEFSQLFPVLIGLKSAKHCPTNLERCAILIYILHSVSCMKIAQFSAYFFDHKGKWRRNDLESLFLFYKYEIKKKKYEDMTENFLLIWIYILNIINNACSDTYMLNDFWPRTEVKLRSKRIILS